MSDAVERGLEVAAAIGAMIGGALFGRATKRDASSDRSTIVPVSPAPITLSNADMDALRGREAALERRVEEQGQRMTAAETRLAKLEAADEQERAEALEVAARRAMTTAANTMAAALERAAGIKPKPKEAPRDPRRERDSE